MAKFNAKIDTTPNAISYEGGEVYEKNPAEEWLNFLFSSYLEDGFYESHSIQCQRLLDLTANMIVTYGPEFVGKAAMFARKELGMRSVSQVVAAMLNVVKFDDKRAFFRNFCNRPDDVSEVFSILDYFNIKRSHALVRGFGDYLSSITPYTLGKYKLAHKQYNMYDLINITHAHSLAIDAYKNGTLESPDTWEVAISTADSSTRGSEWKRLVEEKKLGYLALIRNLRNILAVESIDRAWIEEYLCPAIKNTYSIQKSMVFPYQIYSAYKNMGSDNPAVIHALEQAFMIALSNMPKLAGDTLVILDVSGSMTSHISAKSNITIREVGAVYAMCILLTSENSDVIKFATYAKKFKFDLNDNLFRQIEKLEAAENLGYGTELWRAYNCVDRKYDRIMLISDMQIMGEDPYWYYGRSATTSYKDYCKQYGRTPIYSFDLGNYHTQTDNPNNPDVYLCTSLSEEMLRFIALLENGEDIVDYINNNYDYHIV